MYALYNLAFGALMLATSPWWLLQMLRHGKYRAGLGERMGRVPARLIRVPNRLSPVADGPAPRAENPAQRSIWIHAVSVGEVLAISGLVAKLRQSYPRHCIFISTTTATGQSLARSRFGEENVFYFPLDFAFAIRAYLRALAPELVILAETEFWPNFLRLTHDHGTKLTVVNARISDRSFPRYRMVRGWMSRLLDSVDLFLAQSEQDARRLRDIGAAADRVRVSGNLKFDIGTPPESAIVGDLRRAVGRVGGGPVLVCGSTLEGEDEIVLQAVNALLPEHPGLVTVLAPRHPERFAAVAQLLRSSGLSFWRRSDWDRDTNVAGGVFLLDSIGELASMYSLADLAFVGGSLVPRGGHNILEPAQFGVPVIVGPHTSNFRDMVELFRREKAVLVAGNAQEFLNLLRQLLADATLCRDLGARAALVVRQHAGATAHTLEALQRLLPAAVAEVPAR